VDEKNSTKNVFVRIRIGKQKQKIYLSQKFLKEKLGYKGKNPAMLKGKMPISRKVLAKKIGYKARKWGFFQSHEQS